MLFNSGAFVVFLPIVFILYWRLPSRFQWLILLLSSCYFYMSWKEKYILLIFLTTVVSYVCARLIEKYPSKGKALLFSALAVCLGVLFFFKYFNFVSESITVLCQSLSIPVHPITLQVMLPVGISFYTFQTLSYVLDVYRGKIPAEKHFGKYATFITFFPQLVAGPIERTENLLPQIKAIHKFDYAKAVYGLKIMAGGFFKKIVIADNLAAHVDLIYNDIFNYHGLSLIIATIFFSMQIYCDFSGYSDIAIGTANLFGIDLKKNFSSPYFSGSLKEFWSRWHISLSTWFRDYVYIPLGGSKKGQGRTAINLLLTFLLSGLWHGANWTFVIWGFAHGVLQIIEKWLPQRKKSLEKKSWGSVLLTFVIVSMCWVFFRAGTVQEAAHVFQHCLDGISNLQAYVHAGYYDLQLGKVKTLEITISLLALLVYDYFNLKGNVLESTITLTPAKRWVLYYMLLLWILFVGNFGSNQFVYFQF